MVDKLINVYVVVWAIVYLWFVAPIRRWYRRHRRDADYFTHLGWIIGMLVGVMMIFWGKAQ
jgi:hypothetical protein